MNTYWTPDQYQAKLKGAAQLPDARTLSETIATVERHCFPGLLKAGPAGYPLPLSAALRLYQLNGNAEVAKIHSALGRHRDESFWKRLAAAGSFAYRERDWYLLGRMSYELDRGLVITADLKHRPRLASQMYNQWIGLLLEETGRIDDRTYVTIANGYFASLPSEFVVPVDLFVLNYRGPEDKNVKSMNDWSILRLFWHERPKAWLDNLDAIAPIKRLRVSFAHELAAWLAIHPRPDLGSPARRTAHLTDANRQHKVSML